MRGARLGASDGRRDPDRDRLPAPRGDRPGRLRASGSTRASGTPSWPTSAPTWPAATTGPRPLQSALLRAGWWLPGLWLLGRALDLERELASDERAAGLTGPRRYAACLLRLATDRGGDVAPALWGRRAHLAIRVERLLRPSPGAGAMARAAALGAFSAAALAAVLGALLAVPGTRLTGPVAVSRAAAARSIPAAGPTARAAVHRAQSPHRPRLAATPHRHTLPSGGPSLAISAAGAPRAAMPRRPAPSTILAAHPRRVAPPAAARATAAVAPAALAPAAAAAPAAPAAAAPARPPRARPAAPRTIAFAAPSHRACRTCTAPKSAAADGFGSAGAFSAVAPADAGGGDDDLTRVPALWIRLPSPAPNP